jgi:HEPN domain-containing protein
MAGAKPPLHDLLCFHCQQAAEKYLKALLQEKGGFVPHVHDLEDLLNLLLPSEPALRKLTRGLVFLTQFAVDYRYPGENATSRQAKSALRWVERARSEIRNCLGLGP